MGTSRKLFVKDFVENFLTFFGLNIDVDVEEDGEDIQVDVPSTHLNGFLIGEKGSNLRAIQLLTNMALHNNDFDGNVHVDVAGYKAQRMRRLEKKVERWAEGVQESGEERALRPMSAFDRRTVHKTVSEMEGISTISEGSGRDRHVIIKPFEGADEAQKPPKESSTETNDQADEEE